MTKINYQNIVKGINMTNEEIIKRFTFDLELGVFERKNRNNCCIYYFNIPDKNGLDLISSILDDMNFYYYEYFYDNTIENNVTPTILIVNLTVKNYYFNSYIYYSKYNKLPEYLYDYKGVREFNG